VRRDAPREACERGAAAAHPEDLAGREADRAGPDDAHRLGAQLEADQAGQGVVALAHAQVRMLQVPAGAGFDHLIRQLGVLSTSAKG